MSPLGRPIVHKILYKTREEISYKRRDFTVPKNYYCIILLIWNEEFDNLFPPPPNLRIKSVF